MASNLSGKKATVGAVPSTKSRVDLRRNLTHVISSWRLIKQANSEVGPPFDRPSSVLKRELYRIAHDLVVERENPGALAVVASLGHRMSDVPNERVKLFLGLLNVIADDELARTEKHRYANELAYARRHKMPVELLIGFLMQTGAGKRIKQLVDDPHRTEAWFRPGHQLEWSA